MVMGNFSFRGNKTANELRNFHDHGPIMGRGAVPSGNPDRTGMPWHGARAGTALVNGIAREMPRATCRVRRAEFTSWAMFTLLTTAGESP
jgi:hypothetical protein